MSLTRRPRGFLVCVFGGCPGIRVGDDKAAWEMSKTFMQSFSSVAKIVCEGFKLKAAVDLFNLKFLPREMRGGVVSYVENCTVWGYADVHVPATEGAKIRGQLGKKEAAIR